MKTYTIYEVPNGRMADFDRGMTGAGWPDACRYQGEYESVESCREAFREVVKTDLYEKDDGDTSLTGALFSAAVALGFSDEAANDAASAGFDAALARTQDEATEDADPANWQYDLGDLKYLRVMVKEEEE